MSASGLSIAVAFLWGCSDIISSYPKTDAFRTTLIAQCSGLLGLAIWFWLTGTSFLVPQPFTAVIILGGVSAFTYLALYFSLAKGPLAIVSPIVSAQGAVTLLGAALFLHERVHTSQAIILVFLLLGVVATTFVSGSPQQAKKVPSGGFTWQERFLRVFQAMPGISGAIVTMLGLGGLSLALGGITAIDGNASALSTLLGLRVFSVLFLTIMTQMRATSTPAKTPTSSDIILAALGGLFEMGGGILFVSTVSMSSTMLAGILTSIYPVFPMLYGVLAKKERLSFLQIMGAISIIAGLALLSLALDFWTNLAICLSITLASVLFQIGLSTRQHSTINSIEETFADEPSSSLKTSGLLINDLPLTGQLDSFTSPFQPSTEDNFPQLDLPIHYGEIDR